MNLFELEVYTIIFCCVMQSTANRFAGILADPTDVVIGQTADKYFVVIARR
jgi:hypothetical protein